MQELEVNITGEIMNIIKSEKVKPVDMRELKIITHAGSKEYDESIDRVFGVRKPWYELRDEESK